MQNDRYPSINIRSKNELAKRISGRRLSFEDALSLINDVIEHHDEYWTDYLEKSNPKKDKWVRNASGTNLGKLLRLIDTKILKPNDHLLPVYIFGGISGLNHKAAVKHLLGSKRNRIMLKLDISRFFEQIQYDRVRHFFSDKCGCSDRCARLLADLCCVPHGAKNNPGDYKTIARGFSTSPRLAVWCNLDTFLRVDRLVKKELKGKDPRSSIYVDDIGITASGVEKEVMMNIYPKLKDILENSDPNQPLPLNKDKTKIVHHTGVTYGPDGSYLGKWGFEHLGLQMNRNSLVPGWKTRWKLANLTEDHKKAHRKNRAIRSKRKSLLQYKNYVER